MFVFEFYKPGYIFIFDFEIGILENDLTSEFLSLVRKKNDFHFHWRVQREISTGIEDTIKIILRELGNRFKKYIYIRIC